MTTMHPALPAGISAFVRHRSHPGAIEAPIPDAWPWTGRHADHARNDLPLSSNRRNAAGSYSGSPTTYMDPGPCGRSCITGALKQHRRIGRKFRRPWKATRRGRGKGHRR